MTQNTSERFAIVMGQILQTDISNEDPMRHVKRQAVQMARRALSDGIDMAFALLHNAEDVGRDFERHLAELRKEGRAQ